MIFKIKNIKEGKLSTVIGLVLITVVITSHFVFQTSWIDLIPVLLIALPLFGINENEWKK